MEEALKIGDGFEARFEDAKSTVNQISIDAITKCNAIAPELQASVAKTASALQTDVSAKLKTIEELSADLEAQTESAIEELREEITTNVTSAIKSLTKVSLAQSDCAAEGQYVGDNGKCTQFSGVHYKPYETIAKLPDCEEALEGMAMLTTRSGLVVCEAEKWVPATKPPIGTAATNPFADCKEAKAEYYIEGEVERGRCVNTMRARARVWVAGCD